MGRNRINPIQNYLNIGNSHKQGDTENELNNETSQRCGVLLYRIG